MTASRVDFDLGLKALRTYAFSWVAVFFFGCGVQAQVGPPVKLNPGTSSEHKEIVVQERVVGSPSNLQSDTLADPASKVRSIRQGSDIVVGKISAIDPSSSVLNITEPTTPY